MSLIDELAQLANVFTSYLHTICVACCLRALTTQRDASCVRYETPLLGQSVPLLLHNMFRTTLYQVSLTSNIIYI